MIFKVFGIAILIFNVLLVLVMGLVLTSPRLGKHVFVGLSLFFGFILISNVIAVGLIRLQRWAAVTASVLGLVWSLDLAAALGFEPWRVCLFGMPVVAGLLTPLYATIRNWSTLKSVGAGGVKRFADVLRSSDPLHLR